MSTNNENSATVNIQFVDFEGDDDFRDTTTNPLSLPHYLLTTSKKTDAISPQDVEEEENEVGDGGDSDIDANDGNEFDEAYHEVLRSEHDADNHLVPGDRDLILFGSGESLEPSMRLPRVPDDWVEPPVKGDNGEPLFQFVDNPGRWKSFNFRPVFDKSTKQYKYHALPTGCVPVPRDLDGKRIQNGWEFFYDGWNPEKTLGNRNDASDNNLFPSERKGCLHRSVLENLGMNGNIMRNNDFLFFYQLLFPFCDTSKSGVSNDPRLSYYSKVEEYSNLYASQLGLGGSYGHDFKSVKIPEIVRHDGCVVRDGVRGGSGGAIYRRWQIGSDYDDDIFMGQKYRRWLQIKRIKKLCNNQEVPKKGQDGYDPSFKFDLIWKVLFHNINAISKYADLDYTGDETTWATGSFGEPGAGLTGRIKGKPGVSKGGQTVMVSDVHRIRPRAYMHRHKLHAKPTGWTAMGMIEARTIMEKLSEMVSVTTESDSDSESSGDDLVDATNKQKGIYVKKIYRSFPHGTWDNYFSGDKIFDWVGQNGFGVTMTCRRDRLPADIDEIYLHKKKTDDSLKTKVARFYEPVVAVKNVPATGEQPEYSRCHVSFQSTSSCNFGTVNALNNCGGGVERRQRGKGVNKRLWGIEMNAARRLYLNTYSRIDSIDHLIKNTRLGYRCWKYWHTPMLHAMALGIVVAYDIYLEIAEGEVDRDWKLENPVDYWTFRDVLSQQMLRYDPLKRKYKGDELMRSCTSQKKKDRPDTDFDEGSECTPARARGRPTKEKRREMEFSRELKKAKTMRGDHSRLCGDLTRMMKHIQSMETSAKHPKICKVCGKDSYSVCTICDAPLHLMPTKGENKGKLCFFDYHNDAFFGMARDDSAISGTKKSDWCYPSRAKKRENAKSIAKLASDMEI